MLGGCCYLTVADGIVVCYEVGLFRSPSYFPTLVNAGMDIRTAVSDDAGPRCLHSAQGVWAPRDSTYKA